MIRRWRWGHRRHLHRGPSLLLLLHWRWWWSPKRWLSSSHSHWWRDRHGMTRSLRWWRRHVWGRWPKLLNRGQHHGTRHNLTLLLRLTLPGWWLSRHLHRGESDPLRWWRTYSRNWAGSNATISEGAWWHQSSHRAVRLCNLWKCRRATSKQSVRSTLLGIASSQYSLYKIDKATPEINKQRPRR